MEDLKELYDLVSLNFDFNSILIIIVIIISTYWLKKIPDYRQKINHDNYLGYSPAGTLDNWFANKANYVKYVRYIMNDDAPDYVADIGTAIVELDGHGKADVPVIDNPMCPTKTIKFLIGTRWYLSKKIVVEGVTYYQIGPDEWVEEKYISAAKENSNG